MNTKVKMISEYESFVSESGFSSFMQSECWAEVKEGWKSERIIADDGLGHIDGAMQILVKKVPFMNTAFLYSPRGPVCDPHDMYTLERLVDSARLIAAKYNAYVLKIDPMILKTDTRAIDNFKKLGFRYNPDISEDSVVQSLKNYILDISGKSREEVFQSFESRCRYKIRLAERRGVVCDYKDTNVDEFHELLLETGKRDNFDVRQKDYFLKMLESFGENARLYICHAPDGKAVSGAVAVRFADRVSYVYGASGNGHRNLMPNYLMQWEMIKWAVDSGCKIYDFMGVPHCDDENHPNYGVYRFKKGFNGKVAEYAGEFDYVFSGIKRAEINFMLKIMGFRKT